MIRPAVDIVVPVQRESGQLDRTLALLHRHTENFRLHVVQEPDLNVSEARQKAMEEIVDGDLVCFIDDDSEMIMDGWLDAMFQALSADPHVGAVFARERWGTEPVSSGPPAAAGDAEVDYGPAACMLIDRRRLPGNLVWDASIGLRSGWLGGDFEEVDYCYRLRRSGLKLMRCAGAEFHHTGGRTTLRAFAGTDRQKTVAIMSLLLKYKYAKAPDDEDWFRGLRYVPASPRNDCMLAPGRTLPECYGAVIRGNGLSHVRLFQRMGLA